MNVNIKGLEPRMKVELKEQKIRDALSTYFNDDDMTMIMNYWRKRYSKEPAFVLRRFVDAVCITPEHKALKTQMINDIVNALNQPTQTFDVIEVSKHQACFESYTSDILQLIPAETRDDFIFFMEKYLVSQGKNIEPTEKNHFDKFLLQITQFMKTDAINTQSHHIQMNVDLPLLQTASSFLYTALCKAVGPINADEIIQLSFQKRYNAGQSEEIHQITQL